MKSVVYSIFYIFLLSVAFGFEESNPGNLATITEKNQNEKNDEENDQKFAMLRGYHSKQVEASKDLAEIVDIDLPAAEIYTFYMGRALMEENYAEDEGADVHSGELDTIDEDRELRKKWGSGSKYHRGRYHHYGGGYHGGYHGGKKYRHKKHHSWSRKGKSHGRRKWGRWYGGHGKKKGRGRYSGHGKKKGGYGGVGHGGHGKKKGGHGGHGKKKGGHGGHGNGGGR